MKQKEAVYLATKEVIGSEFEDGMNVLEHLVDNTEAKRSIVDIVCSGFEQSKIDLKSTEANTAKTKDPKALRAYVIGLVNNWHRKDTRLNGCVKYETRNPGSRAGAGDEQIHSMKKLYDHFKTSDPTKASLLKTAIEKRQNELQNAKVKDIDFSGIDPELAAELQK
jgi:hypothetical protein